MSRQRIEHIDALRGVAVLLMVMVHAAATWNPFSGTQQSALAYIISGLGGLAAPLFVTLFGWGLAKSTLTCRKILFRGFFLLTAQFLVNMSAPHLFNPFTPGVLSLMAMLVFTQPLWQKPILSSSNPVRLVSSLFVLIIAIQLLLPSIQGGQGWNTRIEVRTVWILLSHIFVSGTYPIFPWLVFALFGTLLALHDTDQIVPNYGKALLGLSFTYCFVTLVAAFQNGDQWAHPTEEAYLTFFPANPSFLVAAMLGVSILWMAVKYAPVPSALLDTGRLSLTVYVVHFIPFAVLHTLDETQGWDIALSATVVSAYTLMWLPLSVLWLRYARGFTLERLFQTV